LKKRALKLQFLPSLFFVCLIAFYLSGCNFISYETKPIANQQVIEKITAKEPEDPRFKEFLKIQGFKEDSLPIKEWGLNELMLCALFFNPRIEIAKKEWDVAKIQEMIAPIKAPSSVGFESGRQTTGVKENSRDAFGLSFTTLFETADKAKIREERARNQSLIKRLELRKLAWDIKTDLTLNYLRYHQLLLNLQIIRSEIKLQNEILNMLKKRKSLGLSSSIDSNFNQIELNKNIQKLNEEQYQLNETKSKLASILGISAEKLNTMRIANINMDQSIEIFSKTLDDETKQRDVINLGLFNRIDLRIALAKYAVSESQLKLNVANQYPDIRFSPAYIFDYGSSKWLLGVTSLIPTVEKNKNLVEEAKKLRDIESLQVEKIQTSIINELAKLRDNYTNAKDMVRKDTEDLSAANALENSIESKFNQGEIDRIELTQQKLITMQYKRRFYTNKITLMKIGFDFEALLQEPLNTNKNNEK
jgi:outer membrane protein TolC